MGWQSDKFIIKHYRRGDLLDGEAFVLVPRRDPAALSALKHYANQTPDQKLAEALGQWVLSIEGDNKSFPDIRIQDKIPTWVVSLAAEVEAGNMDIRTALYRIAGYAMECEAPENE